uniref:Uncharacterized protein n=1 Tax=Oryza sativa subsp. japonica TaxID=39947 RepID=Q6EQY8_ORYSJ|nr:hypothetical protein [Oryza sativa Japonica Group]
MPRPPRAAPPAAVDARCPAAGHLAGRGPAALRRAGRGPADRCRPPTPASDATNRD